MVMNKKAFNVDVDKEVSEKFSEQVIDRGYTKYRAVEAALRAFCVLPEEAQVKLMSNKKDPELILIDTYREKALEYDLSKISPVKRARILSLVKEVSKSVSPKK